MHALPRRHHRPHRQHNRPGERGQNSHRHLFSLITCSMADWKPTPACAATTPDPDATLPPSATDDPSPLANLASLTIASTASSQVEWIASSPAALIASSR